MFRISLTCDDGDACGDHFGDGQPHIRPGVLARQVAHEEHQATRQCEPHGRAIVLQSQIHPVNTR
jgi:hypothetical protein